MCSKGKMLLMIMMAVKVTKMGKLLFGDKFSIFIRVCGDLKRTSNDNDVAQDSDDDYGDDDY